jgi:hypothetical protein
VSAVTDTVGVCARSTPPLPDAKTAQSTIESAVKAQKANAIPLFIIPLISFLLFTVFRDFGQ